MAMGLSVADDASNQDSYSWKTFLAELLVLHDFP
jgi:hypothetical protein